MIKYFVLCLVLQTCLFEGRAFFLIASTLVFHTLKFKTYFPVCGKQLKVVNKLHYFILTWGRRTYIFIQRLKLGWGQARLPTPQEQESC